MPTVGSFPPEICSLICQDPVFERRDLDSICFISQTFRKQAQRMLCHRFPCLRGDRSIKAWCLSLKRKPRRALDTQCLVLFMPPQAAFYTDDIARLTQALRMCINLKELVVLSQQHKREDATLGYVLENLPCRLTRFVNDYFSQMGGVLEPILKSQEMLKTLELHSGGTYPVQHGHMYFLKTLSCPPEFLHGHCGSIVRQRVERLRLDFGNSTVPWEATELGLVFGFTNLSSNLKSLAISLKQKQPGNYHKPGCDHYAISPTMALVGGIEPHIKHLEIHQFLPAFETCQYPLYPSFISNFSRIETLVLRLPPCQPTGDDAGSVCAYVLARTAGGRRAVAESLMKVLQTLTRLVFVGHEHDYEFRRDLKTGVISGEELINLDGHEWALVK